MGMFKEEAYFLEDLEKRQTRIYDDACDLGVEFKDLDVDRLREVIKDLLDLPGSKLVYGTDLCGTQRQYKLFIAWGQDEEIANGTEYEVLYVKDTKYHKEFVSVSSHRKQIHFVDFV